MTLNIIKKAILGAVCIAAFGFNAQAQTITKHIYAYKDGVVIFRGNASDVDSVALEENKTVVALYKHGTTTPVFNEEYSGIDSLSFTPPMPVADILDVKFDENGTCWDGSERGTLITPLANGSGIAEVNYNKTYETWESHFYGASWGGSPATTCFKADYSQDEWVKEALSDGHTMECLFKVDYDGDIRNSTAKFFSGHESGGTGFEIKTKSSSANGINDVSFVCHTGGAYRAACSGVVPQPGKYYHIVGVYNKEEQTLSIYVDGELKSVVSAPGDFKYPPKESAQWFGIGCDANTSNGAQCADNHIVIARIYDKALTSSEVDGLWNAVAEKAKLPVADLLDVQFTEAGGAVDISPMKNNIEVVSETGKIETYYNGNYGTYAAKINNTWGGSTSNTKTYCKVDFENNQKFRDALADGHSIQTIWKATYKTPISDVEAKWFSAMQGGGTGFLICKSSYGKNGGNELTFLPNVTQTGKSNWIWATSGIVPESEVYYDIVGVWDKEAGTAKIYVNGELMNTVDAKGDLRFANSGANWWGIGCDANPNGGEAGGNWEIVNARVYDKPLTEHEVANLWSSVSTATKLATDSVARHLVAPEDTVISEAPDADLLRIEFGANGAVKNAASETMTAPYWITDNAGDDSPVTYFNSDYNRYVARFDNTYSKAPVEYINAYDYSADQAFQDSIADGHTLEMLVMQDYSDTPTGNEVKPFSSHQSGGMGLMIEKAGDFTFLPHIGGSYRWATSGIQPKQKQYYHVVGVWNKNTGTASIYVDGELRNVVDASGDLKFPSSGCQWFTLAGDPTSGTYKASNGWKGDIVIANVYSAALTQGQVKALYKEISETKAAAPHFVTDYSYVMNQAAKEGVPFEITGKGFKEGDKIAIIGGTEGLDSKVSVPVTLTSDGATISLPANLQNDKRYFLYVERGEQLQTLGMCKFFVTDEMPKGTKVIAHRGYWNKDGGAQNSRQALKDAIEVGCYGSETDVWITTDGVPMINHDAALNGVTIKTATYDECKALTLSNGETMPTLSDLLGIVAAEDWVNDTTKLIIEIKDHGTDSLNQLAVDAVVNAVYEADVAKRVEYITFDLYTCTALLNADSEAKVAYLNGDKSPQELSDYGITGIDYKIAVYRSNPSWIQEARDLEMTTNVWTVDSTDEIIESNNLGIDYITTNNPVEAIKYMQFYQNLGK